MISYVLFALQLVSVNEGISLEWKRVSTHPSWQECEDAYNDKAGFPRRPNNLGWPRYSAELKCKKVKDEN